MIFIYGYIFHRQRQKINKIAVEFSFEMKFLAHFLFTVGLSDWFMIHNNLYPRRLTHHLWQLVIRCLLSIALSFHPKLQRHSEGTNTHTVLKINRNLKEQTLFVNLRSLITSPSECHPCRSLFHPHNQQCQELNRREPPTLLLPLILLQKRILWKIQSLRLLVIPLSPLKSKRSSYRRQHHKVHIMAEAHQQAEPLHSPPRHCVTPTVTQIVSQVLQ